MFLCNYGGGCCVFVEGMRSMRGMVFLFDLFVCVVLLLWRYGIFWWVVVFFFFGVVGVD